MKKKWFKKVIVFILVLTVLFSSFESINSLKVTAASKYDQAALSLVNDSDVFSVDALNSLVKLAEDDLKITKTIIKSSQFMEWAGGNISNIALSLVDPTSLIDVGLSTSATICTYLLTVAILNTGEDYVNTGKAYYNNMKEQYAKHANHKGQITDPNIARTIIKDRLYGGAYIMHGIGYWTPYINEYIKRGKNGLSILFGQEFLKSVVDIPGTEVIETIDAIRFGWDSYSKIRTLSNNISDYPLNIKTINENWATVLNPPIEKEGNKPSSTKIVLPYTVSNYYGNSDFYRSLVGVEITGIQRQDIINVAKTQLGYREGSCDSDMNGANTGVHRYNNYCEYNYWYWNGKHNGGGSYPWCAVFVSWCARMAGIPTSVLKNSAVAGTENRYFNINYKNGISYTPQPGDLFFTKTWSHVGLVYYVDGDYFYTIEGNTSNSGSNEGTGVFSLRRKISNFYFGTPNYNGGVAYSSRSGTRNYITNYPLGTYTVTAKSGLNTRQSPSATSKRLGGLSYGKTVEVTSTNGNWGYTKYGWICLDYARYEFSISTPVYNNVNYSTGNYAVNTAAGLNVRRNPGTGYARITALTNGTEFSVTSVDGSWGYSPDYNGWLCLNYARWVSDLVPKLPVPETPILTTTTSSEIGVGEIISLKWNAVDFTDSYTLSLIDQANSNVVETKSGITGTDASFVVPYAGTFDVSIVAANSQHTSRMAKVHGITAKAPSTVTFKDWNGNTLSTQQVAYGKDATLPQNPSRVGYTFTGWSGKYNTIREDSTVTAQYERNTYTVTFYDYDGVNVVDTQRIKYEDAATAPSYSAPTGYSFVKWDKDFSCITEDTSVKAVIHWTSAYPLEVSTSSSIYRNNTAYITTAIVNNSPHAVSNAKVIVALKTAQGKQLAEAVSSNLSLAAGEVKTITLTANYDGAATVGNIFVVKADNENIPLAKQLTVSVDQGTAWSTWSTTAPPADAIKTESRTEYKYRTKSFTTSSNSSLSGWTKYNTTSAYSDWSGWSAWQDSAISKTDLRDVKEQTVPVYQGYTEYRYSRLKSNSTTHNTFCQHAQRSGQSYYRQYTDWSTTRYPTKSGDTDWACGYCGEFYTYVTASNDPYGNYWYYTEESRWVDTSYNKTQYSYRTRSLNYTYHYYKWNDWSGWSTASQTANADKEVQTRTTYRYISNNPKNIEDTTGQNRTISGSVNNSYAGKQALIHIFTDNGTTQYLGQTTISANGSYSFSFKLKEEPTVSSGDYSVAMSIEGTTASFMLDPILAPVPEYTVTFKNYDGNIINSQTVRKGENAVVPSSPTRAGYEFLGWSGTGTNIQADTIITALYQIKELEVVFVDDLKGTREAVTYNYGDELTVPALTETEAYSVVGWDAVLNGISTVTENLVVTAKYQIKKFDVRFYDYEGNLVKEEKIAYGDGVDAAALENQSPYVFIAWDTVADFGYITENLDVYPVFEYEETVASPTANIDTGSYASEQTVTLTCETEGAKIYYTTDGSDPLEVAETSVKRAKSLSMPTIKGTLYTEPFTLDSSANLVFVAVKENMNDSWYDEETLAINTPTTVEKQHLVTIHDDLGEYVSSCLVPDDSILPIIGTDYSQSTGYTLVGVYRDEEMTMVWNPETDKITESMDLYLKWEKNIYTVNFLDKDGMLIDSQQVPYLESAVSPAVPEVEGFTFSGWDNSYSEICSDIDIKATYIDSTEITKISIDKNSVDLSVNETSKISATVVLGANSSNNHVIWQVEDGTIASVDDEGNVTAIDYGTTQVFAISEDSGDVAICEVNVVCQHNYESVTNNPTCTEDGETISTCSICGDTKTQSIASTGHLSGEWITDKDSTCTAEGTKHKECTVCHETLETATVSKKPHATVTVPGTPATCAQSGKTDGAKCSVCGTTLTPQQSIPATGKHTDNDHNGRCDTCGKDTTEGCDCRCHKTGFAGFIYKIVRIFWKLFRTNQICKCGASHY